MPEDGKAGSILRNASADADKGEPMGSWQFHLGRWTKLLKTPEERSKVVRAPHGEDKAPREHESGRKQGRRAQSKLGEMRSVSKRGGKEQEAVTKVGPCRQ